MRKKKAPVLRLVKESPETRRRRVSSGAKFHAAIFKSKKKEYLNNYNDDEEI